MYSAIKEETVRIAKIKNNLISDINAVTQEIENLEKIIQVKIAVQAAREIANIESAIMDDSSTSDPYTITSLINEIIEITVRAANHGVSARMIKFTKENIKE